MNKIKNTNLNYLVVPMIIITIFISIIICIETNIQYKNLRKIINTKIANVVGIIKENYPEIDTKDLIEILNNEDVSIEYKIGKDELAKYGVNIDETNSIISLQKQMKHNLIINVIVIFLFSLIWILAIFMYLSKRNKKLKEITRYIDDISNRKYQLDIDENSEDELSNLKNELYKITIMLKEESENSKKDKENLKVSVQDISHQLKTPLTSISIMLDNIKDNPNMDE